MANAGRIDLIHRGTDTAFYHKAWNGNKLNTNWSNIGGNFVYDPLTLLWGPDLIYVFGVGFDSAIYYKSLHKITGKWSDKWTEIKAVRAPSDDSPNASESLRWAAKPAVVSLYPKSMEIVGLGSDNLLYHTSWKAGGGWSAVSPILDKSFRESPSLISWGSGRFDVFAVGLDGILYHRWWLKKQGWMPNIKQPASKKAPKPPPSGVFSDDDWEREDEPQALVRRQDEPARPPQQKEVPAWENLQGPFVTTPCALSWAKGRIDLVGIGAKGKVYHRYWDQDAQAWSKKWNEVGMTSSPIGKLEVVSWGPNRLDIFVIGSDRAIHHKWLNTSGSNAWEPADKDETLKGEVAGDQLTATTMGPENLVVFHIGRNSNVYVKSWSAEGGWIPAPDSSYTSIGGIALSRIAACAAQDAMFNP